MKMVTEIAKKIKEGFPGTSVELFADHRLRIITGRESVLSLLSYLKDHNYDHLALISCVDRIDEGELELVYLLNSYLREDEEYGEREKESIIMKTRIPRDNPQIGTSIHVFDNAEPYERELHEMFGISFDGHPRQTPFFLEKEYEIPPFRKDFDTREYVEKEIESIPAVED